VLVSALDRAAETLADRSRFGLDAAHWKASLAAPDAPPRELPRLRRLMHEPGVFDHDPLRISNAPRIEKPRCERPVEGSIAGAKT
jgi:uncharacterized protein DUF1778